MAGRRRPGPLRFLTPRRRGRSPLASLKSLYLIDGNAYIHRAFHALPPLTNSRGEPVGAVFGFARMILKILRQEKPDYVAVCFDTPEPTFRHKAYEAYKATRREIHDALKFQIPLAHDLVRAWGLPSVGLPGYEADDVIATLARRGVAEGMRVVIVTADKDALQLVDGRVSVLNEHRGVLYTPEEVEKKYGLRPDQLVDFFALTGDTSDNVPGVPGIGDKTAVQILQKFGSLDEALRNRGEMRASLGEKLETHREQALMSRSLVTLDHEAPVKLQPRDCVLREPDAPGLTEFFKRLEFTSLLREILPPPKRQAAPVRTVCSEEDLRALLAELKAARELAVDVETDGVRPTRCGFVGVALAVRPGSAWYIPVGHSYEGCPKQMSCDEVIRTLKPFLEDEKLPKIGQNLKFDYLVLKRSGAVLKGMAFDTLIASYCLNPSGLTHGLKELSQDVLGETMTAIEELIGKGAKQITMDKVDVARTAEYAGADAEVVLRLKDKMEPQLQERGLEALFREVEMPLVRLLAEMEEAGIRVDVPYLNGLSREFERDIAALESAIHGMAGEPFNINSPKQLAALLFEKLKLPVIRRTKTGYSTDEEVMQKLSALHPLPAKILEYRELAKLKSTYIDALLEQVDPKTGRVHTSFNQAIAATGRLSSSDPNLQNIPIRTEHGRRIRRAFVSEKGSVLLSADYSQIDLRVLAHVSKDPVLCEAFERGEDVHSATAREIFGLPRSETPTAEQRRVAKSVNFGIAYGQTPFGLSQQLGIDNAQAKDYIERYFRRHTGVERWIRATLEQARKDGYVTTLLHRIRYLPEINASNGTVRAFAERTAMNTPIQGTSADIIKVAMRNVARLIEEKGWKTRMLLQVHDELLFEVPEKELAAAAPLIRSAMEGGVGLDVPIVVDLKKGVNWSEMEKMEAGA